MWQIIVPGYEPQTFKTADEAWTEVDAWMRAGVEMIVVRKLSEEES